jgi:hypothetical protein
VFASSRILFTVSYFVISSVYQDPVCAGVCSTGTEENDCCFTGTRNEEQDKGIEGTSDCR